MVDERGAQAQLHGAGMTGAIGCRYYGRDFTAGEMALLRALIAGPPPLNRHMLSKEFCRRIGWFKPDGGLKDMMARVAMLAMHRDGLIALPAPQGRQNRPGPIVFGPDTEAPLFTAPTTLDEVRPLELRTVVRGTREGKLWNEFVARYHYLGYKTLVGAQMRYAVHDRNGWPLAMLGFSTAAWKLAPRDTLTSSAPRGTAYCRKRQIIIDIAPLSEYGDGMASRSGKSDGIDDLDIAIVEAMAMNGRMSPADIAATIGNVSERTVRNRLNALIERRLLFFPTVADVSVRRGLYLDVAIDTQAGLMASVAYLLVDFPDVEWVGYGGGEHDVYCSLRVFDQTSALEVVEEIDRIPGVMGVKVITHLAVIKSHGFRLRAADELRAKLDRRSGAASDEGGE